MIRWMPILALLLLPVILIGCASDSSIVYRSPSHFYYPNHSPYHYYDSDYYYYGGWPMYQHTPRWREHEIGPMPTKNIDDLSAEEKRQTVDTVNLINLYNSAPNRSRSWWNRPRIRVITSP